MNLKRMSEAQRLFVDGCVGLAKQQAAKPSGTGMTPLYVVRVKYKDVVRRKDLRWLEALEKRGIIRVMDGGEKWVDIHLTSDVVQHYEIGANN
jgi:hypothetical protein